MCWALSTNSYLMCLPQGSAQQSDLPHGAWTELSTGAPVLEDALVSFDCEIEQVQEVGTHSVLMCRVVAIKPPESPSGQDESLVYFNRAYHYVGQVELV